ncbi:uncharacterized protein METZ01_LOCUS70646, partial [marine metagenome]
VKSFFRVMLRAGSRYAEGCKTGLFIGGDYVTLPDYEFIPVPAHQLEILRLMQVPVSLADQLETAGQLGLVIDDILGYDRQGAPQDAAADMVNWANTPPPTVALDALQA